MNADTVTLVIDDNIDLSTIPIVQEIIVQNGEPENSNHLITEVPAHKARKRKPSQHTWKRNVAKRVRYAPKRLPVLPTCKHGENSNFQCKDLSLQDVRKIHQKYHQHYELEWRKSYILQHVNVSSPQSRKGVSTKKKVSTSYFLPKYREGIQRNVKVCRSAFLKILQESEDRVKLLCRKYLHMGSTPPETRGGDHRSAAYKDQKEAVISFIKSFQPIQIHYCRSKNKLRQYLSSDLSISSMWQMFIKKHETHDTFKNVKYEYFRNIFSSHFNIGFGSPLTDACSLCISLTEQIGNETDKSKIERIKFDLQLHKTRAQAFHERLKSKRDDEVVLSFDCQKNLVLPKLPDQAAYYARQLYLYNFTICEGVSGSKQNVNNTFSYVWTEDEYPKGSNQITSAINHRLKNTSLIGISTVTLYSDGCGGQNKNRSMIGMLSKWLTTEAPQSITKVQLVYPVVGHSYIPPDRVFGHLEQNIRKENVISNPKEYLNIFKKFVTIIPLADIPVQDWKTYSESILKQTGSWHFQFQKSKVIEIIKKKGKLGKSVINVKGEPFYNTEIGEPKSITKRGCSFHGVGPQIIALGNKVKKAKLTDVCRLLELHFGQNWKHIEKLNYFNNIVEQSTESFDEEDNLENEDTFDIPENEEFSV